MLYGITPNYEPHKLLEEDVTAYLQSHGFLTASAPYHDRMDKVIVKRVQMMFNPTSLYIRSRADRIAIHEQLNIALEYEVKTHKSTRGHDMVIEALPFCHHIIKSRLDVKCLYAYRNPYTQTNYGFFVNEFDLTNVREIMIPPQERSSHLKDWFIATFKQVMPGIKIKQLRDNTNGTDDPFLIIDKRTLKSMPHWKHLIDNLIQ